MSTHGGHAETARTPGWGGGRGGWGGVREQELRVGERGAEAYPKNDKSGEFVSRIQQQLSKVESL